MQLILPPPRLIHEIMIPTLIIPLDAPRFQEVLSERDVPRVLGDRMETEHGEFEFWVTGVGVELALGGADVAHEAVNVLRFDQPRPRGKVGGERHTLIMTSKNCRDPVYW